MATHPKLQFFRHKMFRYFKVEQSVGNGHRRMLDIGCGDGENMLRFQHESISLKTGLDPDFKRLKDAQKRGLKVQQASGTSLPYCDNAFDLLYIAHVLHHVAEYDKLLDEISRLLQDGGTVFMIETITDHPIIRLARWLHPFWQGDEVEASWTFAQLQTILSEHGFSVQQSGRYNIFYFLFEMFPLIFWPFEIFTPFFAYLDLLLEHLPFKRYAHCYLVLTRN